jgi:MHS family proline/betaine transporter-like MFS transporter
MKNPTVPPEQQDGECAHHEFSSKVEQMTSQTQVSHAKRNTIAGVIGNIMEWYDFAVFGYYAPIIGALFFPSEGKYAALIKAFGVFASGYLMRPIGGAIFGHIGDRMGRKKALQISVLMMALPTTCLGLVPGYERIGLPAPVILIVLRLIQGLSVCEMVEMTSMQKCVSFAFKVQY